MIVLFVDNARCHISEYRVPPKKENKYTKGTGCPKNEIQCIPPKKQAKIVMLFPNTVSNKNEIQYRVSQKNRIQGIPPPKKTKGSGVSKEKTTEQKTKITIKLIYHFL